MENQLPTEKQQTQAEKKQWITPEMEEINLLSGSNFNPGEGGGYSPLPS